MDSIMAKTSKTMFRILETKICIYKNSIEKEARYNSINQSIKYLNLRNLKVHLKSAMIEMGINVNKLNRLFIVFNYCDLKVN